MGNLETKTVDIDIIAEYVYEASKHTDMIVSVGSGLGYHEYYIDKKYNTDIICIDPNPKSSLNANYHSDVPYNKIYKNPKYKNIYQFMNKNNIKNKKITLMLIWPYVMFDEYDIEAIYKLNPENIILYFDISGTSGSNYLQKWLEKHNKEILDKYINIPIPKMPVHENFGPKQYIKINEYVNVDPNKSITRTLYYLSKEDVESNLTNKINIINDD